MVVAYSESHAQKIAATLDDDQFAPTIEYTATEITDAAAMPADWRDLCPWPEHGSTYLEDDITCGEALALFSARRRRQRALAIHGYLLSLRCGHIGESQPSLFSVCRTGAGASPFLLSLQRRAICGRRDEGGLITRCS